MRPGKLPWAGKFTNHIPKGWMDRPLREVESLWKAREFVPTRMKKETRIRKGLAHYGK